MTTAADSTITLPGVLVGDTYNTSYDNSYHDNSSHHNGDNYNITNHYHYGGAYQDMVLQRKCERALKELKGRISKGAAHDSAERGPHAPKCHEGTREAVQGEMISWIDCGEQAIMWLCGPAGCGKTAIAGSVADECHARGWLAGSFFASSFAGQPDRCSKAYIIPSLAYQLLHTSIPGLREQILLSIDANPSVFDKRLDQQLDTLILNPLRKVGQSPALSTWPKAILIDGVDEFIADSGGQFTNEQDRQRSRNDNHREILSTFTRASDDPSFPFRIVIASRPERAIKGHFSSLPEGRIKHIFLDAKYEPEADIALYLRSMLDKIGRDYHLQDDWYQQAVTPEWPEHRTPDVPHYIAEEASEQFIYAATVIRFIQDGINTPIEQLRHILSSQFSAGSKPLAALDALYALILLTSPTPQLSAIWLCAINLVSSFYHEAESWCVKAILESSPGEAELRLGCLSSLVGLSSPDGETRFIFYHKSLLDFLQDHERGGELYVNWESLLLPFLRDRCYKVMKNRGPLVSLPNRSLDKFPGPFCAQYILYHSHLLQYTTSDVDWWYSHVDAFQAGDDFQLRRTFEIVHQHCRWNHCYPACKVWRKGILQICKAKGWRVPTRKELFKDRFKKVLFDPGKPEGYFLNPPTGEAAIEQA